METKTETIKPIHVAGYVRNKKKIEAQKTAKQRAERDQAIMGMVMLVGTLLVIALIFWKVTLTILVAVLFGLFAKMRFKVFIAKLKAEVGDITIYRDCKEEYIWQKKVLKLVSVTGAI